MAAMNMAQILNSSMDMMFARDPDILVFGGHVSYFRGVFRVSGGLQRKYRRARVFDTRIAQGGIVPLAVGMGAYGLRAVAEIRFADCIHVTPLLDRLMHHAHLLKFEGKSWRLKEAASRVAKRSRSMYASSDPSPSPGGV